MFNLEGGDTKGIEIHSKIKAQDYVFLYQSGVPYPGCPDKSASSIILSSTFGTPSQSLSALLLQFPLISTDEGLVAPA